MSVIKQPKNRKTLCNRAYSAIWGRFRVQLQKKLSRSCDAGHRSQCIGLRIGQPTIIAAIGSRQRILYIIGTMICKYSTPV